MIKKNEGVMAENSTENTENQNSEMQKREDIGIKIGKNTVVSVILLILIVLFCLGVRIFNRLFYKSVALPDKKYYKDVVQFSYPKNWIPLGKVFYNPKSIPNLLTYFVATVNPNEIVECQFFSPQMETDNGSDYYLNKKLTKPNPETYFAAAIMKMSPTAKDVRLVKSFKPTYLELRRAKLDKVMLNTVYQDSNPGNDKGRSCLENLTFLPVHYLYEYKENGKTILHLIEGRFVFFNQCFAQSLDFDVPYLVAIKFVKCEDIFSYKAEKSIYGKNLIIYNYFKKHLKKNKEWERLAVAERQEILAKLPTVTTATLDGGEKFNDEAFKNTVYNIEYPEESTDTMSSYYYGKDLKSFLVKWF